jgi:circadian clock protein KaiC
MIDLLKSRGTLGLFTSLRNDGGLAEYADMGLSSLMDAWIKLDNDEANGEINRTLYVIKARGMSHSNQVREYNITGHGITLIEPYIGPEGVLTGTARFTQIAREQASLLRRHQEAEQRRREVTRRRSVLERQINDLRAALKDEEHEESILLAELESREVELLKDREVLAAMRGAAE